MILTGRSLLLAWSVAARRRDKIKLPAPRHTASLRGKSLTSALATYSHPCITCCRACRPTSQISHSWANLYYPIFHLWSSWPNPWTDLPQFAKDLQRTPHWRWNLAKTRLIVVHKHQIQPAEAQRKWGKQFGVGLLCEIYLMWRSRSDRKGSAGNQTLRRYKVRRLQFDTISPFRVPKAKCSCLGLLCA